MCQGSNKTIVPPGPVFLSQAHDQSFQLCINRRAAEGLSLLGAVELLGNQFAVPGENRVGFDNRSNLFECLFSELLADLGEGLRSPSVNRTRPVIWLRRMRFSITRYSLRSRIS